MSINISNIHILRANHITLKRIWILVRWHLNLTGWPTAASAVGHDRLPKVSLLEVSMNCKIYSINFQCRFGRFWMILQMHKKWTFTTFISSTIDALKGFEWSIFPLPVAVVRTWLGWCSGCQRRTSMPWFLGRGRVWQGRSCCWVYRWATFC